MKALRTILQLLSKAASFLLSEHSLSTVPIMSHVMLSVRSLRGRGMQEDGAGDRVASLFATLGNAKSRLVDDSAPIWAREDVIKELSVIQKADLTLVPHTKTPKTRKICASKNTYFALHMQVKHGFIRKADLHCYHIQDRYLLKICTVLSARVKNHTPIWIPSPSLNLSWSCSLHQRAICPAPFKISKLIDKATSRNSNTDEQT